jgi:hypothetical protein
MDLQREFRARGIQDCGALQEAAPIRLGCRQGRRDEDDGVDEIMAERPIISTPSLAETLRSLVPGDYVQIGTTWSYGTVRQTASMLGIPIRTTRSSKGITVMRQLDKPSELR